MMRFVGSRWIPAAPPRHRYSCPPSDEGTPHFCGLEKHAIVRAQTPVYQYAPICNPPRRLPSENHSDITYVYFSREKQSAALLQ